MLNFILGIAFCLAAGIIIVIWDDAIFPLYADMRGDAWKQKNGLLKPFISAFDGTERLYWIEDGEITHYADIRDGKAGEKIKC